MSMLAEPRSKQKWSSDPRNTQWANDKGKFGYQMMTRMGWVDGKGLGVNETGGTSSIKVKMKNNLNGIGVKQANDDNWIAHQDDFNALLSSLNNGNVESQDQNKVESLEVRARSSKTKITYHKFLKSKDLSRASKQDLACIFGSRSKSAPATPQISDDEGAGSDASAASCPTKDDKLGCFQTVTSSRNMNDYFAEKMAALKKRKEVAEKHERLEGSTEVSTTAECNFEESDKETVVCGKRKLGRTKNLTDYDQPIAHHCNEVEASIINNNIDVVKTKKKNKKRVRENKSEEVHEYCESICRKKMQSKEVDGDNSIDISDQIMYGKKTKKQKKKNRSQQELANCSAEATSVDNTKNFLNEQVIEKSSNLPEPNCVNDVEQSEFAIKGRKAKKRKMLSSSKINNLDVTVDSLVNRVAKDEPINTASPVVYEPPYNEELECRKKKKRKKKKKMDDLENN